MKFNVKDIERGFFATRKDTARFLINSWRCLWNNIFNCEINLQIRDRFIARSDTLRRVTLHLQTIKNY